MEIRWNDLNPENNKNDIVIERKIDYEGSAPNVNVVVEHGQTALVYRGGEFVCAFKQGVYNLSEIMQYSAPSLLGALQNGGGKTKTVHIYFINLLNFNGFSFGTPTPISLEDVYSMAQIRVRVAGNYDLCLSEYDARKFFEKTGMRPCLNKKDLSEFFKDDVIKSVGECLIKLNNESDNVCDAVSSFTAKASDILLKNSSQYFESYGLKLLGVSIAFADILPEDMQYLSSIGICTKKKTDDTESVQNEIKNSSVEQAYQPQAQAIPPVQPVSFYVAVNGQSYGPYDMNALSQMFTNGTLTRQTLVWKQGMANWTVATMVPELQSLFGVPPIPSVPPKF